MLSQHSLHSLWLTTGVAALCVMLLGTPAWSVAAATTAALVAAANCALVVHLALSAQAANTDATSMRKFLPARPPLPAPLVATTPLLQRGRVHPCVPPPQRAATAVAATASGLLMGSGRSLRRAAMQTRSATSQSAVEVDADKIDGGDGNVTSGREGAADVLLAQDPYVGSYYRRVEEINALQDEVEELSDEELKARVTVLADRVRSKGEPVDAVLVEAFALVREAAWRTLGVFHYDVQLIGGMVLVDDKLAEMGTGEGKSLVATLPLFVRALEGKGAIFVTVNDYLARRDAEEMGALFAMLGMSVGLVQAGMEADARRDAYACDVTYASNTEFGFDYLRDNLAMDEGEVVLRPLHFCIVDEVDSVLIDEARTPLIISEDGSTAAQVTAAFCSGAQQVGTYLRKGKEYTVNVKDKSVTLTDAGVAACEKLLKVDTLYDPTRPWARYVVNAIKAKELLKAGTDYMIDAGEVKIIDEFTGRVMEGRRWGGGLHQSVEAKEGVEIQPETRPAASVTYQRLFRLFPHLAGMTGTATTEVDELDRVYGLEVLPVPPALPRARRDLDDVVFQTAAAKMRQLVNKVVQQRGDDPAVAQPVLVGTTTVEDSEAISAALDAAGVPHSVLNARPGAAEREAGIVAQAGRLGAVTIATNMAGRGTDILLGGNAKFMARLKVRETLAPLVLGESCRTEVTVPEGLCPATLETQASQAIAADLTTAAAALGGAGGNQISSLAELDSLITASAASVPRDVPPEAQFKIRDAFDAVLDAFEPVIEAEREAVREAGGLYVIGTNRHESRRVDLQLRGRAGRQGDPGTTVFFLSFEDTLFKTFGADKLTGMLKLFRVGEDTPLQNKQVAEALDKVQNTAEDYFRENRRTMFEYEKVVSQQREATYRERMAFVRASPEEVRARLREMSRQTLADLVAAFDKSGNVDALVSNVQTFFPLAIGVESAIPAGAGAGDYETVTAALGPVIDAAMAAKEDDLEKRQPGLSTSAARFIVLSQIDKRWKTHLAALEELKESVGFEKFAGKNVLQEYEIRSEQMFVNMNDGIHRDVVFSLYQWQPQRQ